MKTLILLAMLGVAPIEYVAPKVPGEVVFLADGKVCCRFAPDDYLPRLRAREWDVLAGWGTYYLKAERAELVRRICSFAVRR